MSVKNLAIIPARSGSKGLPDKNIKPLLGKPLMAYTIEAAVESGLFHTVHLSTDSAQYAETGRRYGAEAPFLRSQRNSGDAASSWDVVLEVLEEYERRGKTFDTVTMLQPTSPLRTAEDVWGAYEVMREKRAFTVVSVCEAEHPPIWSNILPDSGCMDGFLSRAASKQRQASPKYFRINGAVYLLNVEHFKARKHISYDAGCFAYIMPQERSVDVDGPLDLLIAEALLRARGGCERPEGAVPGRGNPWI